MAVRTSRFSPRSESPQALEERTVCRQGLRDGVVEAIVGAVTSGQARFELIIGPRGAGKSHLLGLVEARVRERLGDGAVVIGLPEEFHPSSLLHLLAEGLRSFPLDPELGPVERQLAILAASPEDALDRAVEMLRARLRGLPLVLAIENLDVVFAAIGRQEQQRLRRILQTQGNWSIVATSRAWAPAFSKEAEPFYGTFTFRQLGPLDARCCRDLLVRLARQHGRDALAEQLGGPDGLARVQTLRHVLGGYPRAMAFIFPHLHHDRADDVEQALQDLAEELTPYFQEQMSRLSPGQRPIAELLAERWHPLSVTEISRLTFTPAVSTSTHLRHLRQDAIVRSIKLGRQKFYEISEPLFRIARAMKRNELRAQTFLRVLHAWYRLRGEDEWRLETPELVWGEYHEKTLESLVEDLEQERWDAVIARAEEEPNANDPRMIAGRLVALARSGREDRAFADLALVHNGDIERTIHFIAALRGLAGEQGEGGLLDWILAHGEIPMFERMSVAVVAATEHALEFIVHGLAELPACSRRSMSNVLLRSLLPARGKSMATCWRLLAALELEGPSALLEANLMLLTLRAWGSSRLGEFVENFLSEREGGLVSTVSRVASQAARFILDLAVHWSDATLDSFEALLAGRLAGDDTDRMWRMTATALLVSRIVDEGRLEEFREWLRSSSVDARTVGLMVANASYGWVAVGRPMGPFLQVVRCVPEFASLEQVEASDDPNAFFVRLAEPERGFVLKLARVLNPERYAELSAIDSGDGEDE